MWFSRPKPQPETPFFAWSDPEHSVGVDIFDQEHKQLAELVTRLHTTLVTNRDRDLARQLLESLIAQTRVHFAHEEAVLETAVYPERTAHFAEHAVLLRELQDLLRQFHAGNLSALALPMFLKNWLIPHIQTSDRKYAGTLRRQGLR
jgi:hemerythrin-like metal-binding protein